MMNQHYEELAISKIELDMDNPRIAKFLEMYEKSELNSSQIALALGSGEEDNSQTTYSSLYESIKTNKGIIHPIIVNHQSDGKYVVIEGNTRVQIYKEFEELNIEGKWSVIPAIIYENLSEEKIHAIRLQSHLVGPREWDPYSKAKYLNFLSNEECLPMNQVISYCGGKSSEVNKYIKAYQEMEKYYRPSLSADDQFDQRDFSKFIELQSSSVKEAVLDEFNLSDFSKWVIKGNIDSANNVRKLPAILKNKQATETFLKSNIKDAYEKLILEKPGNNDLKGIDIVTLCTELSKKINDLQARDLDSLKDAENQTRNSLYDLNSNIEWLLGYIEEK